MSLKNFKNKKKLNLEKNLKKILQITRVTKVVKGGKILSFRALIAFQDSSFRVGFGIGKGSTVALALQKAFENAKRDVILVPITKNNSIPYKLIGSFGATKILLNPKKEGSGIIASSSLRPFFEFANLKNISAKIIGSRNILNVSKAIMNAFKKLNYNVLLMKFNSFFYFKKEIKNFYKL